MSRIDDIFENVRDLLGDSDGDRWSDAVLLRAINRGQQEIVNNANLLRSKEGQPLRRGVYLYDTPSDCYRPKRFTLDNEKVIELWTIECQRFFSKSSVEVTCV